LPWRREFLEESVRADSVRRVFDEGVDMGNANVEAIELTRRRCRHARIGLVGGNSYVGTMMVSIHP
jgi:hypothetical protein